MIFMDVYDIYKCLCVFMNVYVVMNFQMFVNISVLISVYICL